MNDFAIEVSGLVKKFGKKVAVNGVDLQMPRGAVWGFLGPNGSGKTTTIRMICGLLRADAGTGQCLGYDIRSQSEKIKLHTGYMTQKFSFWTDLTIRENLEFVARLYRIRGLRRHVDETLEKLGLSHRQNQLAGALSGGWKQRMALAAVAMHQPKLLLLDEPTAGVDPQARREFWDEIHKMASSGMTVLVSTHYMDEAERCDRIVYLARGNIIAQGPIANIIEASGLMTFRAEGLGVRAMAEAIRREPGIGQAAYFGTALHVSGTDRDAIKRAMAKFDSAEVTWKEVPPSLEDVFIAMMHDAVPEGER